jgi:hypothetical protein
LAEESRNWQGTPLDMGENLDPEGLQELRIEYETGEEDIFRPRLRREFGSYELQQMAAYIENISSRLGGH